MKGHVIRAENLGKRFDIGVERQKSLGQQLGYWVRGHQPTRSFWAVRNVSFEVGHGEGVGIIGPNGSGKSTLLRIIAGILQPNEGTIQTAGVVNPFLGLGVGLLPQLTVLENLRLGAAMLGFSSREFKRKLDEIIAFSELEDYLYAALADLSAGWAARVGFSIAIHADLEILLIDETLEVGDAYFRKKCRAKFEAVRKQGHTIVLVSHDLDELQRICSRAIYIDGGQFISFGPSADVAKLYEKDISTRGAAIHRKFE